MSGGGSQLPSEGRGPIIGIDQPAGKKRTPWWQFAALAVVAIGVVAWVYDAITTTEEERVAKTVRSYLASFADGDGEAFCEALDPAAQADIITSSKLLRGGGSDCAAGAKAQLVQLDSIDDERLANLDELADISEDEIADDVEIADGVATLDPGTPLVSQSIVLEQVNGEWRITPKTFVTGMVSAGGDAGSDEVMAAADRICASAFGRRTVIAGELLDAARRRDNDGADDAARRLVSSEQQFLSDLERLAEGRSPDGLEQVIRAERDMIVAVKGLRSRAKGSVKRLGAADEALTRTATDQGFSELGCAAPRLPQG